MEGAQVAAREVVEDDGAVTGLDQALEGDAADVTSAARDQDIHDRTERPAADFRRRLSPRRFVIFRSHARPSGRSRAD
jgi:hypothetical protein